MQLQTQEKISHSFLHKTRMLMPAHNFSFFEAVSLPSLSVCTKPTSYHETQKIFWCLCALLIISNFASSFSIFGQQSASYTCSASWLDIRSFLQVHILCWRRELVDVTVLPCLKPAKANDIQSVRTHPHTFLRVWLHSSLIPCHSAVQTQGEKKCCCFLLFIFLCAWNKFNFF